MAQLLFLYPTHLIPGLNIMSAPLSFFLVSVSQTHCLDRKIKNVKNNLAVSLRKNKKLAAPKRSLEMEKGCINGNISQFREGSLWLL